jgi:hypothetical protein
MISAPLLEREREQPRVGDAKARRRRCLRYEMIFEPSMM